MPILMDTNQVIIAAAMAMCKGKVEDFNEDLIRAIAIDSIRNNHKRFSPDWGRLILCFDGKNVWRKRAFPEYKYKRNKDVHSTELWQKVMAIMDKLREEFKIFLPYQVMRVEGAEGDDIITIMASIMVDEPTLIISGDEDFHQLLDRDNLKQWNPIKKQWETAEDPVAVRQALIIRGDSGDGVPNILSPNDCFVTKTRQKAMTEARFIELLDPYSTLRQDPVIARNYQRNRTLVELSTDTIPEDIQLQIMNCYLEPYSDSRMNIGEYLASHDLRLLLPHMSDF